MTFTCRGCGATAEGRRQRRFCSNRCQRAVERRERVAVWLMTGVAYPGSGRSHYVRLYLMAEQGGSCALCGIPSEWNNAPLALVLDHVDGDSENNARENLRLVCPNCDSQLATYKSRNRGRGRHWRRTRYAEGQSY
jgi:5-methylcytosine-specific restriction endonuclease McrA